MNDDIINPFDQVTDEDDSLYIYSYDTDYDERENEIMYEHTFTLDNQMQI